MDWIIGYHRFADHVVALLDGSDKLAHVNAGMAIYIGAQMLLRTRRASGIALQAVLAIEFANEAMDRVYWGSWRWSDTLSDIVATMAWPTLLYAVSRYRRARWERAASAARAMRVATA